MRRKITVKAKLAWLRKNNIILKKEQPRESTTKRLYSFYQKNPLSTPRNLAYGLPKRFEKKLAKEDGTKTYVQTPKGKISTKEYIKLIDKMSIEKSIREMPLNISSLKFSQKFKSGKGEDRFRYVIDPNKRPAGLTITRVNVEHMLEVLKRVYIPDLMESIDKLYKNRRYFYKTRLIGALIIYDTHNMPDDSYPRGVAFGTREEFPDYLWDMLYELLVTDIFRNYHEAVVNLKHFDIFIRTTIRPSSIEKLL